MLPGFRFLFAAIVLSMSILVFGLGAAALLRAAHEEFASNPSWRAPPETMFAQQAEATRPVLAMLRIEPPAAAQKAPDSVPVVAAPAEPAALVPASVQPEDALSVADIRIVAPDAAEPAASGQMSTQASPEIDAASTKIATLGGPPVTIETPPAAKAVSEKKRLEARRAAHRRRMAARARLVALQAQQQANPFAQPLLQPPAVARR
jgi:hypothetical protein